MLRYKTETRPGLVALYDIRPRNGAGQFLQPRSPHGAKERRDRRRHGTIKKNEKTLRGDANTARWL